MTAIFRQLEARWPIERGGRFEVAGATRAFFGASPLSDQFSELLARIGKDENLSVKGRAARKTEWLRTEAVPFVKKARAEVAEVAKCMDAKEAALLASKADKTDVAGALLRGEIRAFLRTMKPTEARALLSGDDCTQEMLTAVMEAPALLSGFSAEELDKIKSRLAPMLHPVEHAAIEADRELVQLATAALNLLQVEIDHATDGALSAELQGGPKVTHNGKEVI